MSKVILVTGGSSGIGLSICKFLKSKGLNVYGTSRYPENHADKGFDMLKLDVRDPESIVACIDALISIEGRIDVLVNNAGIGINGPMEEIPREEIFKNFETNLFGPINLMQTVMPHMRSQNDGLIINITSIAAHIGLPYRSIYSASKGALEILTEAARMEVREFNIRMANLAPGDFATNIAAGRFHAPVIPDGPYAKKYAAILELIDEDVDKGNDPIAVGRAVYKIINSSDPKPHYAVGAFMQKLSIKIKKLAPQKWFERIMINHYKLK